MPSVLETSPTPPLSSSEDYRLIGAGPQLWRVIDRAGRIIGHLSMYRFGDGVRYRARRYHAATRMLRDMGDFWSPDDALDCLRYSR